ncbi:MAG TPA: hypothetical protein VF596_11625 [Pyrinomonadaceae bacterium]
MDSIAAGYAQNDRDGAPHAIHYFIPSAKPRAPAQQYYSTAEMIPNTAVDGIRDHSEHGDCHGMSPSLASPAYSLPSLKLRDCGVIITSYFRFLTFCTKFPTIITTTFSGEFMFLGFGGNRFGRSAFLMEGEGTGGGKKDDERDDDPPRCRDHVVTAAKYNNMKRLECNMLR